MAHQCVCLAVTFPFSVVRSVSSLVMGGVWLMALTNEQGGRQLGRFILYYSLAFSESAICGFLWNTAMAGSGDFFAVKVRTE